MLATVPIALAQGAGPQITDGGNQSVLAQLLPAPINSKSRPVEKNNKLDAVDVNVKADSLEIKPMLNIITSDMREHYREGESVKFVSSANYPDFIESAELRIFDAKDKRGLDLPIAVVSMPINGSARWTIPREGNDEFAYVLRVYDKKGRYDETLPLVIYRMGRHYRPSNNTALKEESVIAPGVGEDRTAERNIQISGGSVTIYGRNVPEGYSVSVLGEAVQVDARGSFAMQRILGPGDHTIDVEVINRKDRDDVLRLQPQVAITKDDWFYVGLIDLTAGRRDGDSHIEDVRPGEYEKIYGEGRLALYAKGKIKGKYLLTVAADTGYDSLNRLFSELDGKDPQRLLKRIDPNRYYPVYGDDSTYVEDAPTQGKFYVRLERNDSRVIWGNYKTEINGTEFLRQSRGLYGAQGAYRSDDVVASGERRTEVTAYAAQPDTLPQREQFLGTGGSAYFMKKQDIVEGSEVVSIEVRDPISGRVMSRRSLSYGEDYSFSYLQGVLILREPLSSTTGSTDAVRDGALGGNRVYLLVEYEYEPIARDVDGYVYGGRVQHWVNDTVRLGVTGLNENTGEADQKAYGADLELRKSGTTFLKAEVAQSSGPGFGITSSTDGGLTGVYSGVGGRDGQRASAWRLEGQVDFTDVPSLTLPAMMGTYVERKEQGFSTLYDQIYADRKLWGFNAQFDLHHNINLKFGYDAYDDSLYQSKQDGSTSVTWRPKPNWTASWGFDYTNLDSRLAILSNKRGYNGSRLDTGVRLSHQLNDDVEVSGFAQVTLSRSGDIDQNNRLGIGGKWQMVENVSLDSELSYGTHGLGGLLSASYEPNDNDHYYFGYRLDPDRMYDLSRTDTLIGSDKGVLVGGIKRRLDETLSAYAENTYDIFGRRTSLGQTYGVVYTPVNLWTFNLGLEMGRVRDDTINIYGQQQSDFDRYAPSLSVSYKDEERGIAGQLRGEVRLEDSDDKTRNQDTYLVAAALSIKTNEDWRFLTNVDAVVSQSHPPTTSFQNTDYIEATIGYAYRPVKHERLNALFKYSWLYDLPGEGQVYSGAISDTLNPAQKSHIISADANYDINQWLSIGGKYGMRHGKVKYSNTINDTGVDGWQTSTVHLGILRADFHVVSLWDVMLEGRVMRMPEANTTDTGVVWAIYRHVNTNSKAGFGYNYGIFSDDLRDLTLDDQGWFLNFVGKF